MRQQRSSSAEKTFFCACIVTGLADSEISSFISNSVWFAGHHYYLVMGVQSSKFKFCACVCVYVAALYS